MHERLTEPLLLRRGDAPDEIEVLHDLRVGVTHHVGDLVDGPDKECAIDAEKVTVAYGPAQKPAQDVTSTLVGGEDAVGDHKGEGTAVVGDDAHRHVVAAIVSVLLAGELHAQLYE